MQCDDRNRDRRASFRTCDFIPPGDDSWFSSESAVFRQAINKDELRSWADHVLLSAPEYPNYVTELSLFDGFPKDVFSVIGFVPDREFSVSQESAILGIAFSRGREPFEFAISRSGALAALERHTEVVAEFRATFPFIVLGQWGQG